MIPQRNDRSRKKEHSTSAPSPSRSSSSSQTGYNRARCVDLNEFISCLLCKGYLIDATTIIECLHSFCKSCIVKYLNTNNTCPKCQTLVHQTKPHQSIRSDPTLQDIVYKVMPGLYKNEMERRKKLYASNPQAAKAITSGEEKGEYSGARIIYSPDDFIPLSLQYIPLEINYTYQPGAKQVDGKNCTDLPSAVTTTSGEHGQVRYLRCVASVPVRILKKFLRSKFELKYHHDVELFYKHDILLDDYSILDLAYIYSWKKTGPLALYYKITDLRTHHSKVPVKKKKEIPSIPPSKPSAKIPTVQWKYPMTKEQFPLLPNPTVKELLSPAYPTEDAPECQPSLVVSTESVIPKPLIPIPAVPPSVVSAPSPSPSIAGLASIVSKLKSTCPSVSIEIPTPSVAKTTLTPAIPTPISAPAAAPVSTSLTTPTTSIRAMKSGTTVTVGFPTPSLAKTTPTLAIPNPISALAVAPAAAQVTNPTTTSSRVSPVDPGPALIAAKALSPSSVNGGFMPAPSKTPSQPCVQSLSALVSVTSTPQGTMSPSSSPAAPILSKALSPSPGLRYPIPIVSKPSNPCLALLYPIPPAAKSPTTSVAPSYPNLTMTKTSNASHGLSYPINLVAKAPKQSSSPVPTEGKRKERPASVAALLGEEKNKKSRIFSHPESLDAMRESMTKAYTADMNNTDCSIVFVKKDFSGRMIK